MIPVQGGRVTRAGRRATPGVSKGASAQALALLSAAKEAVLTAENKQFAAMYAAALEERIYHNSNHLWSFIRLLERPPVGIEEFLDSAEFIGSTDVVLWPEVRKAIIDINKHWWRGPGTAIEEAVLCGSTSCVDGETEFLTPNGWKRIDEYEEGDLVAQYCKNGTATFVSPSRYINAQARGFYSLSNLHTEQKLTPGHRVIYRSIKTGKIVEASIDHIASLHNSATYGWKPGKIVGAFNLCRDTSIPLSDAQIRLMVAVIADGCFGNPMKHHHRYCVVRVKKERKKERIVSLLREAGIKHNYYEGTDGYAAIAFHSPRREKWFTQFWWQASPSQLRLIMEEAVQWDGNNTDVYRTTVEKSATFIQYAATSCGVRTSISQSVREDKGHTEYVVHYLKNPCFGIGSSSPPKITYERSHNRCYCFTVPSSMWVARRGGKVFVTGNSGKSEISKITLLYHLYIVSCLRNPQKVYGLPSSTSIVFVILAAKPHVTKKVLYAPMRKMVETMPYFQKHMRPDRLIEAEMLFTEKNIRVVPGGSDADTVLGEAIIGGIIDEINFMNIVMRSKRAEVTTGRAGMYDQAKTIHSVVTRRKRGRFTKPGPLVGVICTSSSTRYAGDFTDQRKAQVREHNEKGIYIYDRPQYEVWPQSRYTGEKFRVQVGNQTTADTRILLPSDVIKKDARVLEIPIEYLPDFRKDLYAALRDVCGIATTSVSPFFRQRFRLYDAVAKGEAAGLSSFLVKDNVILGEDGMPRVKTGHYCRDPSKARYVHVDLSINNDACGITMLRFDGLTPSVREGGVIEDLPVVSAEMCCSITPDAVNEIEFAEVRAWVKRLRDDYGYPIKAVTYDGIYSVESIQQWKKMGMKAGHLSVDRTSSPYKQLKDGFYDGRILLYEQPVLLDELCNLEYYADKDKVDHPVQGGKDVADSLCGAYSSLLKRRASWNALDIDGAGGLGGRASFGSRPGGSPRV